MAFSLAPETQEAAPAIPDGGTEAGPAPETQETAPAIPDGGTEAGLARADADEPGPGVDKALFNFKGLVRMGAVPGPNFDPARIRMGAKERNPETDPARETQEAAPAIFNAKTG